MTLADARAETRLPAQDLDRARRWYADKLGLLPVEEREGGLRYECAAGVFCLFASAGPRTGRSPRWVSPSTTSRPRSPNCAAAVSFSRSTAFPGLPMVNGVVDIPGNYPSKGRGERGAWFRDSEGNLLGLGQPVR